jgi:hypothetical protein
LFLSSSVSDCSIEAFEGHTQWVDRESTCLLWSEAIPLLVPRSGNAMFVLHRHLEVSTSSRLSFGRLIASKPFWRVITTFARSSRKEYCKSSQHVGNLPKKSPTLVRLTRAKTFLACEIRGVASSLPLTLINITEPHIRS